MKTFIIKQLTKTLKKMLLAFASQKMIEWAIWEVLDALAKSTKTDKDDKFVEKLRKVYYEQSK